MINAAKSPGSPVDQSGPDYPLSKPIRAAAQALTSLAAIAPTLTEAELRICLYLATVANPDTRSARASSREIAAATRVSRNKVQAALDRLTSRNLIAARQGTATQASAYLLNWTQTITLPGGSPAEPPQRELFPQVAPQRSHPVQPPFEIDSDSIPILDRIYASRPKHHTPEHMAEARALVWGYHAKFGPPNPHPPDDTMLAWTLTAAALPDLHRLIYDLMAERRRPGHSYAWYLAVALDRLHGIKPATAKARRAELRALPRPTATPSPEPQPTAPPTNSEPDPEFTTRLLAEATDKVRKLR